MRIEAEVPPENKSRNNRRHKPPGGEKARMFQKRGKKFRCSIPEEINFVEKLQVNVHEKVCDSRLAGKKSRIKF